MSNPTAAMLVIGDEILSGRTRDANMYHLAGVFTDHGIDMKEVRVVSDDADAIVDAIRDLAKRYDTVVTSGGIGPTHDDITADCVATAFGLHIDVRDDAAKLLGDHYAAQGKDFNEARKRMARIPDTATLIDNPVSIAPGFRVENVHVMAGVPSVFRAMVETMIPTLTGGAPLISKTVPLARGEGDVAAPLGAIADKYRGLSVGSYPHQTDGKYGTNIVFRGTDIAMIDAAVAELRALFPA